MHWLSLQAMQTVHRFIIFFLTKHRFIYWKVLSFENSSGDAWHYCAKLSKTQCLKVLSQICFISGAKLEGIAGGLGETFPAFFRQLEKKCSNLWKKCLDCGHLWIKFLIYNAIFKSFQAKKPDTFLRCR